MVYFGWFASLWIRIRKKRKIINLWHEIKRDKIKALGQPRNDKLFENNKNNFFQKEYNIEENSKKYYMLQHSERIKKTKLFPFKDLNLQEMNEFLIKNNVYIFIRTYQSDN